MPKAFKGQGATVLAALRVDAIDQNLLRFAVELCERTHMKLRLISVVEDFDETGLRYLPGYGFEALAYATIYREDMHQAAESALQRVVRDAKVEASFTILHGRPSVAICAEAIASQAALILVGASSHSHRMVPKGFSTAMSLMADSSVPVMVLPQSNHLSLKKEKLKIVIADDLTDGSLRAVQGGFDLAIALGKTDVHHMHALNLSREQVAQLILNGARLGLSQIATDREEAFELIHRRAYEKLASRSPERVPFLEAQGGHYWPEMRELSPLGALDDSIERHQPDFLVFGRHQSIHRKPFGMGKVPFHAMLARQLPVFVMPPE